MKFRKLYWVTEQLNSTGQSAVTGVYTSIYDLVHTGISWKEGVAHQSGLRVSLVKLDSSKTPLGVWASPGYDNMREDLDAFVQTEEMSAMECDELVNKLRDFASLKA